MISYLKKLLAGKGGEKSFGDKRLSIGNKGEDIAAKHLKKQGFVILDKNFKCSLGELDLVARKGNLLVFCEVKTRKSGNYGAPELAVHAKKRNKIVRLAKYYIKAKKLQEMQCRFDVISITMKDGGGQEIKHMEAAFM